MKKVSIRVLWAIFITFIVIGCGSNSKMDPAFTQTDAANGFELINITTPFNVTYAGEEKEFKVQLIEYGVPVIGAPVNVVALAAEFGVINNAVATTDDSGYATFSYTAATPLTNGVYPLEVYFQGEIINEDIDDDNYGETTIVAVSTVLNINVSAGDQSFKYKMVNATTPVIITQDAQSEEISVYLVDANNIGVPNKSISITAVESGYGEVSPATSLTDENGKATFTYTAPNDLVGLSSTHVTLSYTEGEDADLISITEDVEIMISPVTEATAYELVNARTPVKITDENQTTVIDIQLIKNGLPVIDARPCSATNTVTVDCVMPASIPREFGRILNANGSTQPDGYIYYNYEGPSLADKAAKGTSHTFKVVYIDENGQIASEAPITIEMNY